MSILSTNPHILFTQKEPHLQLLSSGAAPIRAKSSGFDRSRKECSRRGKRDFRASAFWPELFKTSSPPLEMEPIRDCQQFDQILETAKELSQPILVDWMAAWCRKCIYLQPKLEKLAADYDGKIKFYCVDVNKVPQALVKRGNISVCENFHTISHFIVFVLTNKALNLAAAIVKKMPTIQIWKDGGMKAEVIGGHKAWLVIEEVKQMIQQFI